MTPGALLEKADRAIASGDILLREGDAEGACNRAYYAMFNAARAGLFLVSAPLAVTEGKSHSGLHAAFNQYLVKPGHITQPLGAAFRRAEKLRQISDYLGDPVPGDTAELVLADARAFVQEIKESFGGEKAKETE